MDGKIRKRMKTTAWLAIDAFLLNGSLLLAQAVRYTTTGSDTNYMNSLRLAIPMTIFSLLVFAAAGFYRTLWQYASAKEVITIVGAALVAALGTYCLSLLGSAVFSYIRPDLFRLHRFVYLLHWIFSSALIGASRLIYRMGKTRGKILYLRKEAAPRRVMIIGAGWTGATLVHDMQNGNYGNCVPAVIIDDDSSRAGSTLSGVPVERGTNNILLLASNYQVDEIILAIATPEGDLSYLLEKCLATGCRVRKFSPPSDVHSGTASQVLDININDLLGRPEKTLDMESIRAFFEGKRVLISGGGGSIGSELCRKVYACGAEKIIIYDINENYSYDLVNELALKYGAEVKKHVLICIGSVRDEKRLEEVFAKHQPQVVLHAAAHKHVPLMEDCPEQAVKNNVFGTYNTAKTALAHHVERFVMISTDKALNPTNVMGASKRMAELIIQAMNGQGDTEFISVRFGNVLGSHGSVVPLFERQIRSGGPITLTHPDIIRYFMTIPEAASLVLQAAAMAKGGELFILDMGRPVKIRELAERMIQLYGPQDGRKIEIVYTGLRPGEKLYEELLVAEEGVSRTDHEKIFVSRPDSISMAQVEGMLAELQACMDSNGNMFDCMHKLLPSFRKPEEVNAHAEGKLSEESGRV